MVIAVFWFIVFEAESFAEYANPIFILCNGINCLVILFKFLHRIDDFFDLFNDLNGEIRKRLLLGKF